MPYDVGSFHTVEMVVRQIDAEQITPDISLAFVSGQSYRHFTPPEFMTSRTKEYYFLPWPGLSGGFLGEEGGTKPCLLFLRASRAAWVVRSPRRFCPSCLLS